MHMFTSDRYGQHWICEKHWKLMSYIFKVVAECYRSKSGCLRNHKAEFYPSDRYINTVKFENRYWDLCDKHLGIYDEYIGMSFSLDFD